MGVLGLVSPDEFSVSLEILSEDHDGSDGVEYVVIVRNDSVNDGQELVARLVLREQHDVVGYYQLLLVVIVWQLFVNLLIGKVDQLFVFELGNQPVLLAQNGVMIDVVAGIDRGDECLVLLYRLLPHLFHL